MSYLKPAPTEITPIDSIFGLKHSHAWLIALLAAVCVALQPQWCMTSQPRYMGSIDLSQEPNFPFGVQRLFSKPCGLWPLGL